MIPEAIHDDFDFHFLVMDDDSYRFESDKTKHAAIAAFGDTEGADNLKDIYQYLWKKSEPLTLN